MLHFLTHDFPLLFCKLRINTEALSVFHIYFCYRRHHRTPPELVGCRLCRVPLEISSSRNTLSAILRSEVSSVPRHSASSFSPLMVSGMCFQTMRRYSLSKITGRRLGMDAALSPERLITGAHSTTFVLLQPSLPPPSSCTYKHTHICLPQFQTLNFEYSVRRK